MTRVYIAGPITGLPNLNRQAFSDEHARLSAEGYACVNPHHIDEPEAALEPEALWNYYMRECIKLLVDCNYVRMLPGWQNSRGACLEHKIATALGMPISYAPVKE